MAPATKSVPDLAKVLRLPRNLHRILRKCCAWHEICTRPCESAVPATKSALDLAKVLCLPRSLYLTLRKRCACCALLSLRSLRVVVSMGRRSETGPNVVRASSEVAPSRRRNKASFQLSGDANSRTGPRFCTILFSRHTRVLFF